MSGAVVIIGGGVTGLAAAYELERAAGAATVTLLEGGPRLGGKIVTERQDGFVIEGGPDSFLTVKPHAVDLCRKLGLDDQLVATLWPRDVFVLSRGRLHPLPDGLVALVPTRLGQFIRSRLFSWPEKVRFALELLVPPHRNGADESVGAFVRRRLGRAAVDRLAAPLLAGIYAGDVDRLSLWATFPQLAEMERRYGSLVAAALRRRAAQGRAARHGTAVGNGGGEFGMFATLRGGLDILVNHLAGSLQRVTAHRGRTAVGVARDGREYQVILADGTRHHADTVIVTTPAFAAARLLGDVNPAAARALAAISYVSTAAVAFGFRRADIAHPLAGHGYVVAHREQALHTACTWVSSKWPGRVPRGHVLLRCYAGRASDQRAAAMADGELARAVLAELRPLLGVNGTPILTRVFRWADAMPQYDVGHLAHVAVIEEALRQTPGIIVTGAGYRGVGIPDCIRQGHEAAHAALAGQGSAGVTIGRRRDEA